MRFSSADGAMDEAACRALRQLIKLHVKRNGGDPHQSLKSLAGSERQILSRKRSLTFPMETCNARWRRFLTMMGRSICH